MKKLFLVLYLLMLINPLQSAGFPEIKNWKPTGEAGVYNPENLYEYINGAAEQYIDYGFQLLRSRDFAHGQSVITVDIYDMGSALNAFGMYKIERPSDGTFTTVGAEATLYLPYQCLLLKDRFYIKVSVVDGELTEELAKDVLSAIAESLPGENRLPKELGLLPIAGRIADSEGYTPEGFLGQAELNRCVYASYQTENEDEFKFFVILPQDSVSTDSLWQELSIKWNAVERNGHRILTKKIPYRGLNGLLETEGKILGVTDCADEELLMRRLGE